MTAEQFLAEVKERGDLDNKDQAEKVAKLVLSMISGLVDVEAYNCVKVSLPEEIRDWWSRSLLFRLSSADRTKNRLRRRLFRRVEMELPDTKQPRVVTWAVFSALREKIPEKESDKIASNLPEELEQLWEMPSIYLQKKGRVEGREPS